jgi:hypothetical protein
VKPPLGIERVERMDIEGCARVLTAFLGVPA